MSLTAVGGWVRKYCAPSPPLFLTPEHGEIDGALGRAAAAQDPRELHHRGGPGGVVVGAVEDHAVAHPEVVIVRAQQHGMLIGVLRRAVSDPDHVVGRPRPRLAPRRRQRRVAVSERRQRGQGITETNYNAIRVPLDLRVSYKLNNNYTLFGAVDNVQNLPTDSTLRRAYRAGVRFNF